MKIHEMPQGSPEWFQVRCGKITGTSFQTMANGRKDTIEKLCLKTAAEIITGVPAEDNYTNPAMEHGTETEDAARGAYAAATLGDVRQLGFLEHDDGLFGVSPDGVVFDHAGWVYGVEIKCPMQHTHLKYLTMKTPGTAYKWQIQGAIWISGAVSWDFVSYCPTFPAKKQLVIQGFKPDHEAIDKLEAGAEYCRKRIKEILEAVDG